MGNAIVCAFPHATAVAAPSDRLVKLVHSNGLVEEFYRPVMVGELSPDYPHHFFCHSQDLLSAISALSPSCSSSSSSSSSSSTSSSHLALADNVLMQLGEIYFLLPLNSPLPHASIAALLSKASIASSKESYRDIHVVPLAEYPIFDSLESTHAAPLSHDFVKQLLAETRLQLPSSISGPFLINPLQHQQQQFSKNLPSSSFNAGRLSNSDPWRTPLETIYEESNTCM